MKCEKCNSRHSKVLETKKLNQSIVRIRKCLDCGNIWETEEKLSGYVYERKVKDGKIR